MAKPFALSAVLMVREQREQVEERALAQINAKCNELRKLIGEFARHIDREAAARFTHIGTVQPAAHHLASERQLASLRSSQAELQRQLLVLEQQQKQQQEQYLAVHSGREMLTDLRKRAHEVWEKDENLREQKRLQDFFLSQRKPFRGPEASKKS